MRILIGADVVPTEINFSLFENADIEALIGKELLDIISNADFRIFNLEVPLSDISDPIKKCGPSLRATEKSIVGIKAIGADLVTVANNHIMDQGELGYENTCRLLKDSNIHYVGAGDNIEEASKPFVFELNDKKIGVYACAEHEFSIASKCAKGANPFDPLESLDHIKSLKENCDYLIVLYHGGKEHFRYPSPMLQKNCRKIVEKGADLVVCQHSHCIGCEEKYNGSTIVYGQGNFLFRKKDNEYWNSGCLIQISDDFSISYIPFVKTEKGIQKADKEQSDSLMGDFYKRSQEIAQEGFVEENYDKYAKLQIENYMLRLSGNIGIVFAVMNKLTRGKYSKYYLERKFKKNKLFIQNMIECEAHRELFLRGLKNEKQSVGK